MIFNKWIFLMHCGLFIWVSRFWVSIGKDSRIKIVLVTISAVLTNLSLGDRFFIAAFNFKLGQVRLGLFLSIEKNMQVIIFTYTLSFPLMLSF